MNAKQLRPREYLAREILPPAYPGDPTPKKAREQLVMDAGSHAEAAQTAGNLMDTVQTIWQNRVGSQRVLELQDHVGARRRFAVTCLRITAEYEAREVGT